MPRPLGLVTLLALVSCYAGAQALPDNGSIQNSVYSNSYFRFTYTVPQGFTAAPPPTATSAAHSLLQLDSASSPQEHISILAEPTRGRADIDIPAEIVATVRQQGFMQSGGSTRTYGGLTVQVASFRRAVEGRTDYLAVASALSHDYILEFCFFASDEQRLAALVQSAPTLEFQPDWSSGEPIDDSAPAGAPRRIRDSESVQERLLVRRDPPMYPPEARSQHIQERFGC